MQPGPDTYHNVTAFPGSPVVPTRPRRTTYSIGFVALAVAMAFFWGMVLGVSA